jgi:hypothetical protein
MKDKMMGERYFKRLPKTITDKDMKTATIQGEKYNESQLFLMGKLVAEWMEAYASERLRDELIEFYKYIDMELTPSCLNFEQVVDDYLKSKQ